MNAAVAVCIAVHLAVLVVAVRRWPPLHPVVLWCCAWIVALSLYAAHLLPYRLLSWPAGLLIAGAVVAFAAGVAAVGAAPVPGRLRRLHAPRSALIASLPAIAIALVLLALFVVQSTRAYGVRATLVTSPEVRTAIRLGEFSVGIKFVYFALAAAALAGIALAVERGRRRQVALVILVTAVGAIYFSTGRATVVAAIVTAAAAASLAGAPLTWRRFGVGVGVLVLAGTAIFYVGGQLIGKTFENSQISRFDNTFSRNEAVAPLALPYQYATASVPALDLRLDVVETWGRSEGCAILGPACAILDRLGIDARRVDAVRPFTADPLPWNTYTVLDFPLEDGGYVLVLPILLLTGAAVGLAWRGAQAGALAGIAGYALLVPPILNTVGGYAFTSAHVVGAILIALACLYLRVPRRE